MECLKRDLQGNVIEGNVIAENTENSFISSQNRLIAALGLKSLIVVETSDAILVANEQSQNVKNIGEILKERNIPQGVEHQSVIGPGEHENSYKRE